MLTVEQRPKQQTTRPASPADRRAGQLIRTWREDRGLTPEGLSWAMYEAGVGCVSSRTIRRIESHGLRPRLRVRFAIAQHLDRPVSSIWPADGAPA